VIVPFVDICGIVDDQFKLSFYNSVETYNINFLRAISSTLCKLCPL
jgi:hypothetical protein